MGFTDRVSQYPNRKKLQVVSINSDSVTGQVQEMVVDVIRDEGTVSTEGTKLNSFELNCAIESAINDMLFGLSMDRFDNNKNFFNVNDKFTVYFKSRLWNQYYLKIVTLNGLYIFDEVSYNSSATGGSITFKFRSGLLISSNSVFNYAIEVYKAESRTKDSYVTKFSGKLKYCSATAYVD